jgi:hypothetical protein
MELNTKRIMNTTIRFGIEIGIWEKSKQTILTYFFRVYTVKGSDDYIYRLWDWEGAFYKKAN